MGEEIARQEEDVARVKEKGRTAMLISFGCAGLLASSDRGKLEGLRNAVLSAHDGRS